MKVRITSGSLWAISFPIMIAGVSETVVDVTDAIFLGHYGITELGAVALADSIYLMLVVFAIGLADGMQVLIARRAGEGLLHPADDRPRLLLDQSSDFLNGPNLDPPTVAGFSCGACVGLVRHKGHDLARRADCLPHLRI